MWKKCERFTRLFRDLSAVKLGEWQKRVKQSNVGRSRVISFASSAVELSDFKVASSSVKVPLGCFLSVREEQRSSDSSARFGKRKGRAIILGS